MSVIRSSMTSIPEDRWKAIDWSDGKKGADVIAENIMAMAMEEKDKEMTNEC